MVQLHRISISANPAMVEKLKKRLSRGIRQQVLNNLLEAFFEGMDKYGDEEVIGQTLRGKTIIGFKRDNER